MSSIEEEELRRRKLEEALEVKSLRRIISAYLNYPEAAEEDIRRYERCFRKLPLAHKVLFLGFNKNKRFANFSIGYSDLLYWASAGAVVAPSSEISET
ncbi:UNVERIFIED_CONTAM: hypothetical protein Sangu_1661000 [Sesamum angustifolium]|uniref:Uncharacterized protein n=1 Tax=Sesamum angustifolium TaxID=2727405 RepID=A0AAW2MI79_9LAMI